MHNKFIIKRTINELLDEMEQTAKDIEGILRTATHLNRYCKEHEHIIEIHDLTHITKTLQEQLFLLYKELYAIVSHDKYNKLNILEQMSANLDSEYFVTEE